MSVSQIPTPAIPLTRVAYVTTSSTWVHPDGYSQPRRVTVIKFNGGNGGVGGGAQTSPTTIDTGAFGGAGGGSGFVEIREGFITSNLTIVIGAGGTGGTGGSLTTSGSGGYGVLGTATFGGTTTVIGTGVNMIMSNTVGAFTLYSANLTDTLGVSFGLSGGGRQSQYQSGGQGGTGGTGGQLVASSNSVSFADNGFLIASSAANYATRGAAFANWNIYAPGGGGAGGGTSATPGDTTGRGPGPGGMHSLAIAQGGTGGTFTGVNNANATGGNGTVGGLFGCGGGGGGGASVRTSNVTYTVTGGRGGDGGAGGVIIWY